MRQTVLRLAAGSVLGLSVLLSFTAHAQQQQLAHLPSAWTMLDELPADVEAAEPWIRPSRMQPVALDVGAMRALLANAPLETTPGARGNALMLELPRPDGTLAFFQVLESPVMVPELQARYPQIRTYIAQGVDDATEVARFDLTPAGFHAQVLSTQGSWYIDPVSRNDTTHYASYWKRDLRPRGVFRCLTVDHDGVPNTEEDVTPQGGVDALTIGPTLRTYRLAVAATGEYTAFHGGTAPLGLAAIVTSVNRVTGVYESELGIRLTLVAQNDQFVYTNAATDIFSTPGPNDASMTSAMNRFTTLLTSGGYDVGHLYHRAANSGVAGGIGIVCNNVTKGRGVSQTEPPVGDPFSVDYVAHELGHQFGGRHSFNNCSGGPGDAADIAHEPGSGITIMGYAGICGDNDLADNSVPHFASINYDQIRAYVTSTGACGPQSSTGNNAPTVNAGPDFVIPASTPFILTATGSDPDGDAVTFSWEQRDGGTAAPITGFFDNGTNPLVRFESPTTSPVRYIPRLSSLASNSFFLGEILPTTSRVLDFRAVARDNRAGGGGLNFDDMTVTVVPSATGAFRVTSPSTAQSWIGGETRTVTWVVSNTASAPINTANVSIWFSADNGQTWPTQLVSSTPNDGEATITVPSVNTTQGRIMVRAVNNIFFNINQGGAITVLAPVAGVDLRSGGAVTIADNVGNGNANTRVDVGESAIQLTIPVSNLGLTTATNVTGTLTSLTPTATVVSNSATYPAITSLTNASNASAFVVSVSPSHPCGSPIALQFAVTSAQGSGSFNISLPTGVPGGPGPANRYIYAGSPVALGTGNAGPVNVPLVVARSNGTIADINFSFDGTACNAADAATTNGVSQTWNGDMTYTLISPAGTRVTLFNQRGGSGNHLCNTLFDDSATVAVASVGTTLTNLFSGAWRPESPLSAFNGQSPLGTWNLELRDAFASSDAATVRGFSVYVGELLAPVCEPPAAGCDSIDFNNNGVFPEDQDVVDFFNVLAGGSCPTCGDIDFNNNGVFPEDQDVIDFFNVLAGGAC